MELESSKSYGSWTGEEIQQFLEAVRVPLRISFSSKNGPLIVPVWFEYHRGSFWSCSPDDSLLVSALRGEPEVAFDVSTNDLPYRGVRGRGVAICATASDQSALNRLIERYLANTDNPLAQWLLNRDGSEAVIEIEVGWLTSWDFSDRMEGIEKIASRLPDSPL